MASNFEPNVNPPTPPWSARDSSISQIESTGVNERKNGETSYNDGSLSLRTVDEEERPEISISPTFAASAPASVNGLQGISPLLLESASSEDLGEDGLVEASLDDEVENQLLSQRFHLDSPEDDERSSLYSGMSEGLEFKVADFMRKIADLENNLKKATDEKEELHNSLKSSREATATLMRECEKLRGEIDRLKAQNESASLAHQEKVTALHREVKRVRESSESMVLQYAQSEKELLLLGQAKDGVERKLKEMLREKESLVTRVRTLADEKSRLARNMDSKCAEASQLSRDLEKSKEELTARDVKLKWLQNKLVEEMEAHRQTQNDLKQTLGELQDARDETESVRRECQDALSRCREEAEDEKLAIHQQAEEAELVLKAREELGQAKARCQSLSQTNGQLEQKIESLQSSLQESEKAVEESEAKISSMSSELSELKKVADELEILKGHFQVETEKSNQLSSSLEEARVQMAEAKSDLALCQQKERELLELTDKLTEENVTLRSSTSALKEQVTQLQEDLSEVSSLKEQQVQKTEAARECVTSLEAELQSLRLSNQEKDKEKEDLALKIVALEDEIRATKKKHTVALKDLSRELVACRRRLEEGGSAVPLRERPSPTAPGPSSERAPKRRDDSQEIDRVPAVHPSADPSLPSQEMLIRKVVRLQQALVRRREKMDGMEEHRKQLIRELGKKTKIIQHYVLGKQTDALTSCEADCIKAQIAQKGGIMASLYKSKAADGGMTLELSLEINKRLQAVLEDTLLKNITLKENLHTMGEEIARLMAPPPTQKASAAGNKAK